MRKNNTLMYRDNCRDKSVVLQIALRLSEMISLKSGAGILKAVRKDGIGKGKV